MPGHIEVFIFLIPTLQLKLQKQPSRGVQRKSVLKICSKFTGEHPWRSVILILKSHFVMGVQLQICCKFAAYLHNTFL